MDDLIGDTVDKSLNPLIIREELQPNYYAQSRRCHCLNPLIIREELQPHTLFLSNKISKLQGALGRKLLLTIRAIKHPRGTY